MLLSIKHQTEKINEVVVLIMSAMLWEEFSTGEQGQMEMELLEIYIALDFFEV